MRLPRLPVTPAGHAANTCPSPPSKRAQPPKPEGTGSVVTLLLGSLFVAACGCGSGGGPPGPPPPPEVTVAKPIVHQIVEWDRYTGRLAALESVDVRARVRGYLRSINFDEGQIVEKDTVLCVIDQRPFRAAVSSAEAGLGEARARLQQANAQLEAAKAGREKADATLVTATREFDRVNALRRGGTTTQATFDAAQGAKLEAEAGKSAAMAEIAAAEAAIQQANAAVATAQANLRSARLDLEYTLVTAPVTGRVGNRGVTLGNLVDEGTVLTTIVSRDPIHAYFDANEQALLKYSRLAMEGSRGSSRNTKNPVYLRLVDESGYPHRGHMDFVDNRVDANTGTMRGRAIFPNDDDLLTPGMFGEIRIPGSGRYEAILVPDEAIGTDQSEKFVYVLDDADTAVRKRVDLGPLVDGLRVVRRGVESGDRVIVSGLQRVAPGTPVKPKETTVELDPEADGLPDDYEPIPREEWLSEPPPEVPPEAREGIGGSDEGMDDGTPPAVDPPTEPSDSAEPTDSAEEGKTSNDPTENAPTKNEAKTTATDDGAGR